MISVAVREVLPISYGMLSTSLHMVVRTASSCDMLPPIFNASPSSNERANGRSCTRREIVALMAPCCAQLPNHRAWAAVVHDKLREVPQGGGQHVAPVHGAVLAVVEDVIIQVALFLRYVAHVFEVVVIGIEGGLHMFGRRGVLVPAAKWTGCAHPCVRLGGVLASNAHASSKMLYVTVFSSMPLHFISS